MSWIYVSDTTQRSRKLRKCGLCYEKIQIGESYIKRFGYGDDGPVSIKMHHECELATKDWDEEDWNYRCDFQRPKKELK